MIDRDAVETPQSNEEGVQDALRCSSRGALWTTRMLQIKVWQTDRDAIETLQSNEEFPSP